MLSHSGHQGFLRKSGHTKMANAPGGLCAIKPQDLRNKVPGRLAPAGQEFAQAVALGKDVLRQGGHC